MKFIQCVAALLCAGAVLVSAQQEAFLRVNDFTLHEITWRNPSNINLDIVTGDSVRWSWDGNVLHSVLSPRTDELNPGALIDEPNGAVGNSAVGVVTHEFTETFDQVGEVRFNCDQHDETMIGVINVQEPPVGTTHVIDWFQPDPDQVVDFSLTIELNDVVNFVWADGFAHSITSPRSDQLNAGGFFQFPALGSPEDTGARNGTGFDLSASIHFTKLGEYQFDCITHPQLMNGVITVVGAGQTNPPEPPEEVVIQWANNAPATQNIQTTINVGESVTWRWADAAPHTVTALNNEFVDPPDNVPVSDLGREFTYTFNQAGSFDYFCVQHPATMTGTITVVDPDDGGDGDDDCVFNGEAFQFCEFIDNPEFDLYWTVDEDDETLDLLFSVPNIGWHAVGFSSEPGNQPMVGSNVVFGCADFIQEGTEGQDYFLGGKAPDLVNAEGRQGLLDITNDIVDGRCVVRFIRPLAPEGVDAAQHIVDDNVRVVLAQGGNDKAAHAFDARVFLDINFIAGGAGDIVNFVDPVRVAHGAMMAIAFGLLFPLGILSAHHKKAIYRGKTLGKLQLWFHVHRTCMPLAALLSTIAWIMILINEREFYAEPGHLILGCIVMALIFVQLSFVRLRPHAPKPGEEVSPERRRWNLAHWWNGRLAATLAVTNTIIGFFILNPSIGYFVAFLVIFASIVITYIVLEVMRCVKGEPGIKKADDFDASVASRNIRMGAI